MPRRAPSSAPTSRSSRSARSSCAASRRRSRSSPSSGAPDAPRRALLRANQAQREARLAGVAADAAVAEVDEPGVEVVVAAGARRVERAVGRAGENAAVELGLALELFVVERHELVARRHPPRLACALGRGF